ncbi:MAG: ABC transporter ATP-binding protein [Bacteriovoracaceae bacterium]|nr:ABC transporter ATP-binding protein [Bacteriovoracaceae bacterium]
MQEHFAIELDQVSKKYGHREVLKNLSFKVRQGVIHGLLGSNGAGKTTTFSLMTGLLTPDEGNIRIEGKEQNPASRLCMGFLSETVPLYRDMRVRDFLKFMADLYAQENPLLDDLMEKVGLTQVQKRLIGNLSKGFQQRVGIAATLVHNPRIIILDEPMVGLDPSAIHDMRELIKNLKGQHTVLLSSHILHEMGLLCDEITILSQGQACYTGNVPQNLEQIFLQMTERT